ncbi:MAG: pilus assembly protein [Hyphomonadaceae bacterium]|nr:pilus assembly protein [Hyphomonadaceae bacterium]
MAGGRNLLTRDTRGVAALEFALIAPILGVMIYGLIEMTLRFRAADEYQRYLQQAGDYLSREDELFSSDIDEIYAVASQMIRSGSLSGNLHLDVSSIGFKSDGAPELLWRRHRGDTPPSFNISDAAGLGAPGESVIRVSARFSYETPISQIIGAGRMNIDDAVYFRPRVTRLIAIDGQIHDDGADWVNDGDSTVGENNGEEAVGEVEP